MLTGMSACRQETPPSAAPQEHSAGSIARQVSLCSRLYTTEYTIRKFITFSDDVRLKGSFLSSPFDIKLSLGDRKVAIPLIVSLKGYVDLSGFSEDNVQKDGNRLVLTLPNPQIAVSASKIDHDNIHEYVSLLRSNFTAQELEGFQRQGLDSILSHLDKTDMEEQTRSSAVNTLMPLLRKMGYRDEQIVIRFRSDAEGHGILDWINIENLHSRQKKQHP